MGTIEINGKKYDAATGRLLNHSPGQAVNVDGIVKPSASHKKQAARTHHKSHQVSKSPQRSKTLMREYVKKPTHTPKTGEESTVVQPKLGAHSNQRIDRAKNTEKSPHIARFADAHRKKIVKHRPGLVVKEPEANLAQQKLEPLVEQFEDAIQNASSHLEEYIEERLKFNASRKFAYALASLGVLVIVGALAYQFIPEAKVKVASHKAGFAADIPNYSPAGYGLSGKVEAASGEVALAYKSRTDDNGFKITQTPTSWNSQSLLGNFLVSSGKQYESFESAGKTVYIYDGSNATWVDGGIWYKLEGNATLASDQILKIVNSL